MPTPIKSIKNCKKHYTNAEKEARNVEEDAFKRENIKLRMPKGVKDDLLAQKYWKQTLKESEGIELLDNTDADILGGYCIILARHERLNKIFQDTLEGGTISESLLKQLSGLERLILSYADKLGLTPTARLRLAKRKAEEPANDPDADLYGN